MFYWLYVLLRPEEIIIKVNRKDNNTIEYRLAQFDGAYYVETHVLHRSNGPALIVPGQSEEWYYRGVLHRDSGPAIERINGVREWFQHGLRHRDDGPAIEYPTGEYAYYFSGKKHRWDGPAVGCNTNGNKYFEYWINGVQYSKYDFENR